MSVRAKTDAFDLEMQERTSESTEDNPFAQLGHQRMSQGSDELFFAKSHSRMGSLRITLTRSTSCPSSMNLSSPTSSLKVRTRFQVSFASLTNHVFNVLNFIEKKESLETSGMADQSWRFRHQFPGGHRRHINQNRRNIWEFWRVAHHGTARLKRARLETVLLARQHEFVANTSSGPRQ